MNPIHLINECTALTHVVSAVATAREMLLACLDAIGDDGSAPWNVTGMGNTYAHDIFVLTEALEALHKSMISHAVQLDKEVKVMLESLRRPDAGMGDGV